MQNLRINPKNKSRYEIGFQQQFGRAILHPTLPMDTSFDDTSILHFIGKTNLNVGRLKEIQSKAYASFVQHQMHNLNRPNAKMMQMITDVESKTIGGKVEGIWKWNRLKLYNGIDWFYLNRDGTRNSTMLMQNGTIIQNPVTVQSSVWQNTDQTNFVVFSQGEFRFSQNNHLDFGFRIDRNELKIKDPSSVFTNLYTNLNPVDYNISGTLSYSYLFDKNQQLKFQFGRGVRSGDMIERSINQHQVGMDGASYLGNPTLSPEVNHQFEISYSTKIDFNNPILRQFQFNVSAYNSFVNDMIVAKAEQLNIDNQIKDIKRFVNIDKAYKIGFDFDWKLFLPLNIL